MRNRAQPGAGRRVVEHPHSARRFHGLSRFDEFQENLGIDVLARRLIFGWLDLPNSRIVYHGPGATLRAGLIQINEPSVECGIV